MAVCKRISLTAGKSTKLLPIIAGFAVRVLQSPLYRLAVFTGERRTRLST